MCLINIKSTLEVIFISKKFLLLIPFLALILVATLATFSLANQDFDGLFTMNTQIGTHYSDIAYCLPNGALGCQKEFWEDNSGCEINGDEQVVYYYDNSCLVNGESDAWQHALNTLTGTYMYNVSQNDGNLVILTNDLGAKNIPPYIVGVSNNDGSKAVFVGGFYLENLKTSANSVEFK